MIYINTKCIKYDGTWVEKGQGGNGNGELIVIVLNKIREKILESENTRSNIA